MGGVDWVNLIAYVLGTIVTLAKMRSYVTVDEYRTKQIALHKEINDERAGRLTLEGDVKVLKVEIGYLRGGSK